MTIKQFALPSMLIYFLTTFNVYPEEPISAYVVIPTEALSIQTSRAKQLTDNDTWQRSVWSYTESSDRALRSWCHDLSSTVPAVALSTKTVGELGIDECPVSTDNEIMTITVPMERLSSGFAHPKDSTSTTLHLYLRTPASNDFEDLAAIGNGILLDAYRDPDDDNFSELPSPTLKDGFFPNFCQRCKCCVEGIR